jgi:hypothetical protein
MQIGQRTAPEGAFHRDFDAIALIKNNIWVARRTVA